MSPGSEDARDPVELSLVIVTYRRAELLRRCLDSLPPPPPGVEALLIVNGRGPDEDALAAEESRRRPWLKIAAIERAARGAARNAAVSLARGRVLYFLDDDTILPEGFVARVLAALARHPEAPCLGGPNLTPPQAAPFQRAGDFLLRSPLGAGPMRVRYSFLGGERPVPGWSLMLCSLGVRREVFENYGLRFPDNCASAEENLLLSRIERAVGAPVYCPDLYVYHERRGTLAGLGRQIFQSGQGRVQITRVDMNSFQPATAAPLLFFIYIAALPLLARLGPSAFVPAVLYAAACLVESLRLAFLERDFPASLRLLLLFPFAHACYAAGMVKGLIETASGRPTAAALMGGAETT
jgi:GT2 family glycosyltransferase